MSGQSKKDDNRTPLNIPMSEMKLRMTNGSEEVWDILRKKWVALTPEEYVRQQFTSWLITEKNYPAGMMGNEISLKFNGMIRRCDTIIYDNAKNPIGIVEYKAPSITITQGTFDQIARYNMIIKARVLIVSNGLNHYCCRSNGQNYIFLKEIPKYDEI